MKRLLAALAPDRARTTVPPEDGGPTGPCSTSGSATWSAARDAELGAEAMRRQRACAGSVPATW